MGEHQRISADALRSAVAEALSEVGAQAPLLRIGVDDRFGLSGNADELLEHYGLTPGQMAGRILACLK